MLKKVLVCVAFLTASVGQAGEDEGLADLDRRDYAKAYKAVVRLAHRGDDRAMVTAGLMYHEGQGRTQDYGKAMDWYIKAFEKGNGDAYSNIGVMYRDGLGVAKNKRIAYCLFLITHVCSLGGESTQLRANSCLRRILPEMTKEDFVECFNYTDEYIRAFVLSRGTLKGIPDKYLPTVKQPALKDKPWWVEGELDFLKEKEPAPDTPAPAP